eukprot:7093524-Karenia_brevis.AAC.1
MNSKAYNPQDLANVCLAGTAVHNMFAALSEEDEDDEDLDCGRLPQLRHASPSAFSGRKDDNSQEVANICVKNAGHASPVFFDGMKEFNSQSKEFYPQEFANTAHD